MLRRKTTPPPPFALVFLLFPCEKRKKSSFFLIPNRNSLRTGVLFAFAEQGVSSIYYNEKLLYFLCIYQ